MTTESSPVESQAGATGATEGSNEPQVQNGATTDVGSETTSQDSSTGQDSGAKGPSTSLEAAKKAVETMGTAAESPPAEGEAGKRQADGKPEGKPEAADADKSLPFHNHPRWKEVTTAKKALEAEVEGMKPKAERWDALDARFRETGMAPEDVDRLFDGGAMLKRVGVLPQEVDVLMKVGAALKLGDREIVKQLAGPVFESLGLTLAEVLPQDIRDQIESGAITEEAGRRMADLQLEARLQSARRERTEQTLTQKQREDQAQQFQGRIDSAAMAWERKTKATDADWSRKEPFIVEAIKAQVARRAPQSEAEVEAICQAAYDQVTRIMRTSAPVTRPAVSPARGNGSSTDNRPVPRSSLEAAKMALGR